MQTMTVFTILWCAALAAFVAAMVYRAHLTQHETDELFLDDNADHSFRKQEHDDIVRRVNFIQPFCQGAGVVTGALTMLLVGVEVVRALPYVHFH
ncbi:MAG: hypothetical protein PW792_12735 [Acidobacteriaceae bacterium]|nr:hypothetical protein [Acidobacteriaceae bacterium]